MTTNHTLDKWDIALIRLLKGERFPTFLDLRQLWAERNLIEIEFVSIAHVTEHMAVLVEQFNPRSITSLIYNTQPSRMWQYGSEGMTDHWEIWATVLGHHLRMTEVVKLPGYREAVEAEKQASLPPLDTSPANLAYISALKNGEEVVECGESAMKGTKGTVYLNETDDVCVRWWPPEGAMGTSVTWGTRRVSDVPKVG